LPDFLTAAVDAFSEKNVEIAYGALLSEWHEQSGSRILFRRYNRAHLLQQNFIDLNVVVHRRALFERYGGFDEGLTSLMGAVAFCVGIRCGAISSNMRLSSQAARSIG
jgi:hypothetical protein